MHEPEGNEVAINSFQDILWLYPQVDTIIYDRACHIHAAAKQDSALEQVKYLIVDRFIRKLDRRIKDLNTSICEQTFSWFRGYGPMLNEMRVYRHKFLLLFLATKHNQALEQKKCNYVRPIITKKRKASKPYKCNQKNCK
ncbi:Uncharacterized protein SCF082_LOCUS30832 [Durusdinium trenchii]|uniref:Transposase n=1 Tax=Durusdinium trenchii TaxID=1381693 RepID=A0ABP0N125_9DINO